MNLWPFRKKPRMVEFPVSYELLRELVARHAGPTYLQHCDDCIVVSIHDSRGYPIGVALHAPGQKAAFVEGKDLLTILAAHFGLRNVEVRGHLHALRVKGEPLR